MEKKQCKKCKKIIEGYNPNHVNFLMKQHMLTHEEKEEDAKSKNI